LLRAETTKDYQVLIDDPSVITGWNNEKLLLHFLETRFIMVTETVMNFSAQRMAAVIKVAWMEYEEILKRMKEGTHEAVDHSSRTLESGRATDERL
jgi:hypothetical protein